MFRCRLLLTVIAALVTLSCNGPFGLLPGGALEGPVSPAPVEGWTFAGDSGTAQLETNPEEPYSVNIAYTILDGRLYINAGDTRTQWVENMESDPHVRLRIDGALYELQAERVEAGDEIDRFAEAWTSQSMFRRDPRELEEVWLYRFAQRR